MSDAYTIWTYRLAVKYLDDHKIIHNLEALSSNANLDYTLQRYPAFSGYLLDATPSLSKLRKRMKAKSGTDYFVTLKFLQAGISDLQSACLGLTLPHGEPTLVNEIGCLAEWARRSPSFYRAQIAGCKCMNGELENQRLAALSKIHNTSNSEALCSVMDWLHKVCPDLVARLSALNRAFSTAYPSLVLSRPSPTIKLGVVRVSSSFVRFEDLQELLSTSIFDTICPPGHSVTLQDPSHPAYYDLAIYAPDSHSPFSRTAIYIIQSTKLAVSATFFKRRHATHCPVFVVEPNCNIVPEVKQTLVTRTPMNKKNIDSLFNGLSHPIKRQLDLFSGASSLPGDSDYGLPRSTEDQRRSSPTNPLRLPSLDNVSWEETLKSALSQTSFKAWIEHGWMDLIAYNERVTTCLESTWNPKEKELVLGSLEPFALLSILHAFPISEGDRVVDIGAGTGKALAFIAAFTGACCYGMDIQPFHIIQAVQLLGSLRIIARKQNLKLGAVTFEVGNFLESGPKKSLVEQIRMSQLILFNNLAMREATIAEIFTVVNDAAPVNSVLIVTKTPAQVPLRLQKVESINSQPGWTSWHGEADITIFRVLDLRDSS